MSIMMKRCYRQSLGETKGSADGVDGQEQEDGRATRRERVEDDGEKAAGGPEAHLNTTSDEMG